MCSKKVIRKLAMLFGAAYLSLSILVSPIALMPVQAAEAGTVQPLSDKIEYRWKVEDGKLYKRLFNYSTANWVGDWIYVCDVG